MTRARAAQWEDQRDVDLGNSVFAELFLFIKNDSVLKAVNQSYPQGEFLGRE